MLEAALADLNNSTSATISQNCFQRRVTLGAICREGWRRVKPRRYPGPRVSSVSTAHAGDAAGHFAVRQSDGIHLPNGVQTGAGWLANKDRRGLPLKLPAQVHGGGECLAPDDDKQFARPVDFVVTEQRMQQAHIQTAVATVVTTQINHQLFHFMFVDELEQALTELRQRFFLVIADPVEFEVDRFVLRHVFKPVIPAAWLHRERERSWREFEQARSQHWPFGFADNREAALLALSVADGEAHFVRVGNQPQPIKKLWRAEEGAYIQFQTHRIITRSRRRAGAEDFFHCVVADPQHLCAQQVFVLDAGGDDKNSFDEGVIHYGNPKLTPLREKDWANVGMPIACERRQFH